MGWKLQVARGRCTRHNYQRFGYRLYRVHDFTIDRNQPVWNVAAKLPISRRRFIKTGLIFVPTVFSEGLHGSVHLAALEPEVYNWMGRVVTNAGHYTSLSVVANDIGMKMARPLRSSLLRWNTYTGGDLLACLCPLINDKGSTADTNSNFVSGDYTQATGLTGNLTTKRLSTGFLVKTGWASNDNASVGVYIRTKSTGGAPTPLGAHDDSNANGITMYVTLGGSSYVYMNADASPVSFVDAVGTGHYVGTRTAANLLTFYRNGVSVGTNAAASGTISNAGIAMPIHASYTGVGYTGYVDSAIAGYHIGTGFTAAQASLFYQVNQRINTILGRQV